MKKFFGILMTIIFIGLFEQAAFAELPEAGEIVVEGKGGEFKPSFSEDGNVLVDVPILPVQIQKEGLATTNWQLYASVAYPKGKQWMLIPQDNIEKYTIETSKNDGMLNGEIVPADNHRYVWVRVWGKDKLSGKWLWIDQASKYMRLDKKGNPGYEVIVDLVTGEPSSVPDTYKTRD